MFAHLDMLPMKISNVILFKFMFSALSRFSKLICVTKTSSIIGSKKNVGLLFFVIFVFCK